MRAAKLEDVTSPSFVTTKLEIASFSINSEMAFNATPRMRQLRCDKPKTIIPKTPSVAADVKRNKVIGPLGASTPNTLRITVATAKLLNLVYPVSANWLTSFVVSALPPKDIPNQKSNLLVRYRVLSVNHLLTGFTDCETLNYLGLLSVNITFASSVLQKSHLPFH